MNHDYVAVEITPADIREVFIEPVEDSSKCSTKTALGGLCIFMMFGVLVGVIIALIKSMNDL
jgi:hypothetical protein